MEEEINVGRNLAVLRDMIEEAHVGIHAVGGTDHLVGVLTVAVSKLIDIVELLDREVVVLQNPPSDGGE